MNLATQRHWITPFVIGSFLLMAVTGVLMFFHLDSGLNKSAHEWLGWAMLAAVGLHLVNNMNAFKRYFSQTTGRVVMAVFAVVLAMSFVSLNGQSSKPPFLAPIKALSQAPLNVVAQVAGMSTAQLREQLASQGIASQNDNQTLFALVGDDQRRQMETLGKLFQTQGTNPAK